MIPLDTIQVASPCSADWNAMPGDDQVRFCQSCRKNVYNLSEMTQDEAQTLVNRLEGRLCVRFYTRADGTLLTQDCPVGLRAVRRNLVKKLSYAAAVLFSCASGLLRWNGTAQAVTVNTKPPAKPQAVKPKHEPSNATVVRPLRMGRIAAPAHTMGKPVMPKRQAPPAGQRIMLGEMQALPTMGAPTAATPKP